MTTQRAHLPPTDDPADHAKPSGSDRVGGKVAAARGRRRRRGPTAAGRRPSAAAAACSGSATSNASDVQLDATPLAVGDVAEVGEQPVADVDHRGGAGERGQRRPRRTAARAGGGPRPAPAASGSRGEHRQPAGGPALPAGDRDDVAGPGAGADHRRRGPARSPSAVTAITTRSRADDVAADDAGADPARTPRRSPSASSRPTAPGRSAGAASPTSEHGRRRPPIASMSARFCAAALWPTSAALGPVAPEVPALDEQVGGHHDPPVGRRQHRGVVAGTEQHRPVPAAAAR